MKRRIPHILVIFLCFYIGSNSIIAQEEKQEQYWYCIEETVKPEMIEKYIQLSMELITICEKNNFPFLYYTWSGKNMVYELWTPIESLNDIKKIEDAWDKMIEVWGEEKYAAFNATKLNNYSKTCIVRADMMYVPDNPNYEINPPYCRWIEVYLKSGMGKAFEEAVGWINEKREDHDYGVLCRFAEGGLGYDGPCYIVFYAHDSMEDYMLYESSTPESYKKDFQEYLKKIRQLTMRPAKLYDYNLLWDLSYKPAPK